MDEQLHVGSIYHANSRWNNNNHYFLYFLIYKEGETVYNLSACSIIYSSYDKRFDVDVVHYRNSMFKHSIVII